MSQVKSFFDLASLFDDVPDHVPGKWFLLPDREILTKRKKQFANKAPDVDLNDDERALMAANIQAAKIHQERQLEINP